MPTELSHIISVINNTKIVLNSSQHLDSISLKLARLGDLLILVLRKTFHILRLCSYKKSGSSTDTKTLHRCVAKAINSEGPEEERTAED
jgi:hypothetical protein